MIETLYTKEFSLQKVFTQTSLYQTIFAPETVSLKLESFLHIFSQGTFVPKMLDSCAQALYTKEFSQNNFILDPFAPNSFCARNSHNGVWNRNLYTKRLLKHVPQWFWGFVMCCFFNKAYLRIPFDIIKQYKVILLYHCWNHVVFSFIVVKDAASHSTNYPCHGGGIHVRLIRNALFQPVSSPKLPVYPEPPVPGDLPKWPTKLHPSFLELPIIGRPKQMFHEKSWDQNGPPPPGGCLHVTNKGPEQGSATPWTPKPYQW